MVGGKGPGSQRGSQDGKRKPAAGSRRDAHYRNRVSALGLYESDVEFERINRAVCARAQVATNTPVYLDVNEQFYTLARQDYEAMRSQDTIAVNPRVKELLLMQSIVGHAASGHGRFRGVARYRNACLPWVYEAIGANMALVRSERELLIDHVGHWIKKATDDPKSPKAKRMVGFRDKPLLGISMLEHVEVDPLQVLAGMYFGSRMDNYLWRERVQKWSGLQMGGGINVAVDLEKLIAADLTMRDLSTGAHGKEELVQLNTRGITINRRKVPATGSIVNGYVRLGVGHGISDDGGAITSGVFFGKYAPYGLFVIDGCDTIDKDLPTIERQGRDEQLGDYLLERCKRKGIPLPDNKRIEQAILVAAIDPGNVTNYPDCSMRRFFLVNDTPEPINTAAALHLEFVRRYHEGGSIRKLPKLSLGFARVESDRFYQAYSARLKRLEHRGMVSLEK